MKIKEIIELEVSEDLKMPQQAKKLSPEMEARKKADQEKMKAERDMSTRSSGSRLRGKGRGTAGHDQSFKEV